MDRVGVARNAMATRFEIVMHGPDPIALRAAGEEALSEVDRLEAQLSLYRPESEVARVNARAAREAVRVTPGLFRLLAEARGLSAQTGGAFDITVAPLVRCWGFMGGTGRLPERDELARARACTGMDLVELDAEGFSVRFAREGVMLDLGAVGKGYAVERAAAVLREAGVTSALVNGGTSSVHAIGSPPDQEYWRIGIENPPGNSPTPRVIETVELRDEAFSVSAVWGRTFQAQERSFGHMIDPRSGQPVTGTLLAAVAGGSATVCDAMSTALLVLGEAGQSIVGKAQAGRSWVMMEDKPPAGFRLVSRG